MAEMTSKVSLLLYAIGYRCHHDDIATLIGILSAEDAINRSSPNLEELNSGLNILLAANLIAEKERAFIITLEGKKFYDAANKQDGSVYERLSYLTETLRTEFSELSVNQRFELGLEDLQQAHNAYYGTK